MKEEKLKVSLSVDGAKVELNEFVHKFIGRTLMGMVSPLKGVKSARRIDISVEKEQ